MFEIFEIQNFVIYNLNFKIVIIIGSIYVHGFFLGYLKEFLEGYSETLIGSKLLERMST